MKKLILVVFVQTEFSHRLGQEATWKRIGVRDRYVRLIQQWTSLVVAVGVVVVLPRAGQRALDPRWINGPQVSTLDPYLRTLVA
ncbi:MAG: hypothetical protein ACR2PG_14525, partial [Hyphomicrobiaceae bacterium]